MPKPKYHRILLKLSGEALMGELPYGLDPVALGRIAGEIKDVKEAGAQIGVVIGAGNILRGAAASKDGVDRVSADYMGMLATVINSLALQGALEKIGVHTRVQSAIHMQQVAEPYVRRKAVHHLEKGSVVIVAAGTGNPYFTTDTAASLRAVELEADVLLKGTKVDGVYDADPMKDARAKRYERLEHIEVLNGRLEVMDATAVSLCMQNKLPIIVFNIQQKGNLMRIVAGEAIGTLVEGGEG